MEIREVNGYAHSSSIDPRQKRLFHGGVLSVADDSGLGIDLDEDVIEQCPLTRPWTEFRYDDA